jgi:hypothetical protein
MAIEVMMVKGLTEDAVKQLMNLKVQMDQRFSTIDTRLGTIETLLTQILARLPEKP